MINCMRDFKVVGCVLKDSWQRKNQDNSHTLRNFRKACEIHGSFRMGCKNFTHPTSCETPCKNKLTLRTHFVHFANFLQSIRKFCTPNTVRNTVQKPKGSVNPFRTPNAISQAMRKSKDAVRKPKDTLPSIFKTPEP